MSIRWAKRLRTFSELDLARAQGFSGAQLPVSVVMEWEEERAFTAERDRHLTSGMIFETFESPLPKGVRVTEAGFNVYSWTEYLKTAIRRIAELGCKTLAWGEGRARILPLEGENATLKETFNQFMFILCDISDRYGITVCIEPLGPRRTNYLNDLKSTAEFLSLIGKRNSAMALSPRDLYEMGLEPQEWETYQNAISHIHLEHPMTEDFPAAPRSGDGYDYRPFFSTLKKVGYGKTVSLPFDSDRSTLAFCNDLWMKS